MATFDIDEDGNLHNVDRLVYFEFCPDTMTAISREK